MSEKRDDLIPAREAARHLGVATSDVLRLVDDGTVEGFRRDRDVVVRLQDVEPHRAALTPRAAPGSASTR